MTTNAHQWVIEFVNPPEQVSDEAIKTLNALLERLKEFDAALTLVAHNEPHYAHSPGGPVAVLRRKTVNPAQLSIPLDERFPVMWPHTKAGQELYTRLECPRFVPWASLAVYEHRILRNHGQSLKTLAARGGMSPCEMHAAAIDLTPRLIPSADPALSIAYIKQWLANHD